MLPRSSTTILPGVCQFLSQYQDAGGEGAGVRRIIIGTDDLVHRLLHDVLDTFQHGGVLDLRLRVDVQQIREQQLTLEGAQFPLLDSLLQGTAFHPDQSCGTRECDKSWHASPFEVPVD